jgi:hypothetical protein
VLLVRLVPLHTTCRYLFLTDILPTAWHGTELSEVGKGDTVAIWGAGPGNKAKTLRITTWQGSLLINTYSHVMLRKLAGRLPGSVYRTSVCADLL